MANEQTKQALEHSEEMLTEIEGWLRDYKSLLTPGELRSFQREVEVNRAELERLKAAHA